MLLEEIYAYIREEERSTLEKEKQIKLKLSRKKENNKYQGRN